MQRRNKMNSNGVCDHFHETQTNLSLKQNNPERCTENPVLHDEPPICKTDPELLQLPTTPKICLEKLNPYQPPINDEVCTERHDNAKRDKSLKWRCPDIVRETKFHKSSLGNPVGVSYGSFALNYLEPPSAQQILQGYATCLIAFGEIFLTPENEWSIIVINRILEEGKTLLESAEILDTELTEADIAKRFVLCKNTMEIDICEPSIVGKVKSEDITIPNLKDSLHKFFVSNTYCLLWIGEFYFLIWNAVDVYFCFDCYGRDQKNCQMERQFGFASLLCVRCIDNIVHLISNLSDVGPDDMFTLRKIQMVKLLTCCENAEDIVDHKRTPEYRIVNDRYATLAAHLSIGSYCFREFRFKQSLAVAVIALVYSKIDASCTWDGYIVDQVIISGTEFYKKWTYCDHAFDLGIQDIPGKFELGQFTVEIVVNPMQECGQWLCIPNFRHSSLTTSIKRSFQNTLNLLVQIERKTYALWKRNNYYYLLDPYEHQRISDGENNRSAVLHMCSTLNNLCCIFTQIILEIPTSRPFYIHIVKICSIVKTSDLKKPDQHEIECSCISRRPNVDDNDEVVSMNESIEDIKCKREFKCFLDRGEVEEDFVADLDSPGLSETQIIPDYQDVKCRIMGLSDDDQNADDDQDDFTYLSLSDSSSGGGGKSHRKSKTKDLKLKRIWSSSSGEDTRKSKMYDKDGRDKDGLDRNGLDKFGRDANWTDGDGRDRFGRDKEGLDKDGYDKHGFDKDDMDKDGYDKYGYDLEGRDRDGIFKNGLDKKGRDRHWRDKDGRDRLGRDESGYDIRGFNKDGYNRDGFDKDGYNRNGFNKDGFDRHGLDKNGKDKHGKSKDSGSPPQSALKHRDESGKGKDSEKGLKSHFEENPVKRKSEAKPDKKPKEPPEKEKPTQKRESTVKENVVPVPTPPANDKKVEEKPPKDKPEDRPTPPAKETKLVDDKKKVEEKAQPPPPPAEPKRVEEKPKPPEPKKPEVKPQETPKPEPPAPVAKPPPKPDPPKPEPPKPVPPKVDSPKPAPPKVDPPKSEPPKSEPPKVDTPKSEPPKVEPPKVVTPKVDSPKPEPPKPEPAKPEPPKAAPAKPSSPKAAPAKPLSPKVESPKAEPSKPSSPKSAPAKPPAPPKVEPPKPAPPPPPPKPTIPKHAPIKFTTPPPTPPTIDTPIVTPEPLFPDPLLTAPSKMGSIFIHSDKKDSSEVKIVVVESPKTKKPDSPKSALKKSDRPKPVKKEHHPKPEIIKREPQPEVEIDEIIIEPPKYKPPPVGEKTDRCDRKERDLCDLQKSPGYPLKYMNDPYLTTYDPCKTAMERPKYVPCTVERSPEDENKVKQDQLQKSGSSQNNQALMKKQSISFESTTIETLDLNKKEVGESMTLSQSLSENNQGDTYRTIGTDNERSKEDQEAGDKECLLSSRLQCELDIRCRNKVWRDENIKDKYGLRSVHGFRKEICDKYDQIGFDKYINDKSIRKKKCGHSDSDRNLCDVFHYDDDFGKSSQDFCGNFNIDSVHDAISSRTRDKLESSFFESRGCGVMRYDRDGRGVYFDSVRCLPNSYPGFCPVPRNIAVIGSKSGTYESICNLLRTGFRCSDRILTMTPWGNYVVFKTVDYYFVFDGCTCNVQRFRHIDLTIGTAGLLCFRDLDRVLNHLLEGKYARKNPTQNLKNLIDDICKEFTS